MDSALLTFLKENGSWLGPIAYAFVGGLFGAYLGPHVQWGIEKKRETREHRRCLIARWRAMVSEIAQERAKTEGDRTTVDAYHMLQRHRDFPSFQVTYDRYSRSGFRGAARWFARTRMRRWLEPFWRRRFQASPENTFVAGVGMPARVWYMIGQIGEIERWWGLH
jgi:hypothetical protein